MTHRLGFVDKVIDHDLVKQLEHLESRREELRLEIDPDVDTIRAIDAIIERLRSEREQLSGDTVAFAPV